MKSRVRILALISFIVGSVVFIWVVRRAGPLELLTRLRALGWGFLFVLGISSVRYLARGLAWQRCIEPADRTVGLGALIRARLAGESLGDLTVGPLVAEPLRLVALGSRLPLASGISSLAVENLAYAVSSCFMIVAGSIALLASFAVSESLRSAVLLSLVVALLLIGISVLAVSRRWRLLSSAISECGRFFAILARQAPAVRHLEDYVYDFFARRPGDFLFVGLCEVVFHLAGVVEIYVALSLIGYHVSAPMAFIFESVNRAINIAFIFVPALVGVDEIATGLLTGVLGLGGTAGVALAIVRKLRMFFWIGVGLGFLARV
jgi:glycosyltransferase 2 family protein